MAGYEALGAGYLWVIVGGHGPLPGDDRVALVDLRTDKVASVLALHNSATSIAFGYGSAWVGTYTAGRHSWLEAIRAGAEKPTKVALESNAPWGPTSIAVGAGAVWVIAAGSVVSSHPGPTLFEIDPQTLRIVRRVDLSSEQAGVVAVGAGAVWVTGGIAGTGNGVTKIDPHTGRILGTTPLGLPMAVTCWIAGTSSAVWASIGNTSCDTIGA
jgi:hypothetical protein